MLYLIVPKFILERLKMDIPVTDNVTIVFTE